LTILHAKKVALLQRTLYLEDYMIRTFLNDESGATAIEYGLIAALISVVCIGVWQAVGDNLNTTFGAVRDSLAP